MIVFLGVWNEATYVWSHVWITRITGYVNEVIKTAYDEVEQIITIECWFTLMARAQLVSVINFE